ncbi:MAG TPA: hypothetical protein VGQ69_14420 [Gemmatimonadales bacterium]|jgi:hypothetical protein|nr:hypothetical protein [Gemmatimonadales bacterium]
MGFLDKIFGRKKASAGGGDGMSLAGALAQQQESMSPQSCDVCGTTYLSSLAQVCILSTGTPTMRLDIGGYCPRCRKQLCQRHLAFDRVVASHLPNPEAFKDSSYGVVCESCGTRVRHDRNAEPERFITVITLDAKDLERPAPKPTRAKPKPEVAAPSGKFSLHKLLIAATGGGDPDAIPSMICMKCFAFHSHPVPVPVFGFDAFKKLGYQVGPSDFEIDIGGDCPTCGAICGKHIELKEISMEGSKGLALHCAIHGAQLS